MQTHRFFRSSNLTNHELKTTCLFLTKQFFVTAFNSFYITIFTKHLLTKRSEKVVIKYIFAPFPDEFPLCSQLLTTKGPRAAVSNWFQQKCFVQIESNELLKLG